MSNLRIAWHCQAPRLKMSPGTRFSLCSLLGLYIVCTERNEKMSKEIHIRGMDEEILNEIDVQVRSINSRNNDKHKISRNDYILSLLKYKVDQPMRDYQKTIYDKKVEALNNLLQEYVRATDGIFYLLLSGDTDGALEIYDSLSSVYKMTGENEK